MNAIVSLLESVWIGSFDRRIDSSALSTSLAEVFMFSPTVAGVVGLLSAWGVSESSCASVGGVW